MAWLRHGMAWLRRGEFNNKQLYIWRSTLDCGYLFMCVFIYVWLLANYGILSNEEKVGGCIMLSWSLLQLPFV